MLKVVETADTLEVTSPMPVGRRVLFGLLALVPLLAPYELLLKPGWETIFHPLFGLAALISLGALFVSGFLMWAAIAGLESRVGFDLPRRTLTTALWAPIVPLTVRTYSINDLLAVRVETTEGSDGSPSYSLQIETLDGRSLRLLGDYDRSEVEAVQSRIARFLSRRDLR
jgi:hypothetical protein